MNVTVLGPASLGSTPGISPSAGSISETAARSTPSERETKERVTASSASQALLPAAKPPYPSSGEVGISLTLGGTRAAVTDLNGDGTTAIKFGNYASVTINANHETIDTTANRSALTLNDGNDNARLNPTTSSTEMIRGVRPGYFLDFAGSELTSRATLDPIALLHVRGNDLAAIHLNGHYSGKSFQDYSDDNKRTNVSVVLDTIPPATTEGFAHGICASSSDGITNHPSLVGSGEPKTVGHFPADSTAITQTSVGEAAVAWTFTPDALAGNHTVLADEKNAVGNSGSASVTFPLATTTINPITSDEANARIAISGSAHADRILKNQNIYERPSTNIPIKLLIQKYRFDDHFYYPRICAMQITSLADRDFTFISWSTHVQQNTIRNVEYGKLFMYRGLFFEWLFLCALYQS
jgi:hypothetical protein